MILIITKKSDYTCDFVVDELNRKGISYLRLNTDSIKQLQLLSFHRETDNYYCCYDGQELDVKSIWFRRIGFPELSSEYSSFEENYIFEEFKELIYSIPYYFEGIRWVSNPEKIRIAENKSLQLKTAVEVGFKVPKTVITTDISLAINLIKNEKNSVILKPIFRGRYFNGKEDVQIFTNRVSNEILNIGSHNSLPSIYQNEIKKDIEIRVTVIGDECFSAATSSHNNFESSVDWRRDESEFHILKIPKNVELKCISLVKKLGLNFGAIDLIKDKNGEYIFLEIILTVNGHGLNSRLDFQ